MATVQSEADVVERPNEGKLLRLVSGTFVALVGLGVALVTFTDVPATELGGYSLSSLSPGLFAGFLVLAGIWLLRSDFGGRQATTVLFSTVAGLGVFSIVTGTVVVQWVPLQLETGRVLLAALNAGSAGGSIGFLTGVAYTRQNVTVHQLRDRERELQKAYDEYQDLFGAISDAVIVHDVGGDVLAVNEQAVELLEYPREQFRALSVEDVRERPPETASVDNECDGDLCRFETVYRTRDGRNVPVEVSARRIRYSGQQAMICVARDVSRRKAYETVLRRESEQLAELNRVLRHDIRNDMQVILGLTETMLDADRVDASHREDLETVLDTGYHVVELTKSARDIEQTVNEEGEFECRPVALEPLVEDIVERRRATFEEARFTVGSMPDVSVDANHLLESVFRNLLNNAVLHNDKSIPEVEISATREGDTVRVTTADNGPGVPDDRTEAVFEAGEKSLDSQGSGVGLYLVRTLVGEYGGEVWITDADLGGAAVHVELPVVN